MSTPTPPPSPDTPEGGDNQGHEPNGPAQTPPPANPYDPTQVYPMHEQAGQTRANPYDQTHAYPAGGQYDQTQAYPANASGAPSYGAPGGQQTGYAPPAYAAPQQTGQPDNRPKRLAITALILAVAGVVVGFAALIPLLWVQVILAGLSSLLLVAAFIIAIVALVSKAQGGTGFSIAALVLSVLGQFLAVSALLFGLLLVGMNAATGSSTSSGSSAQEQTDPSPSAVPTEDTSPTDEGTTDETTPGGTYDREAYLAAVRPEIEAILSEAVPDATEEIITSTYPDDTLVSFGEQFAALAGQPGAKESARESFIPAMTSSSGGVFNDDQAARFFDTVWDAAEAYLQE